jgi:hypothetical protein
MILVSAPHLIAGIARPTGPPPFPGEPAAMVVSSTRAGPAPALLIANIIQNLLVVHRFTITGVLWNREHHVQ